MKSPFGFRAGSPPSKILLVQASGQEAMRAFAIVAGMALNLPPGSITTLDGNSFRIFPATLALENRALFTQILPARRHFLPDPRSAARPVASKPGLAMHLHLTHAEVIC